MFVGSASSLVMERAVFKQKADHFYLKLQLEFSPGEELTLDAVTFKSVILQALQALHGQVGASIMVDILKFIPESMESIVRVKESGFVKLWSALTLFGCYQDKQCAFRVLQISPHLMALAADSRQWKPEDCLAH